MFINVVLGGAAIIIGTLLNAFLGHGWVLPDDFTLGATVLAVVIAATSLEIPAAYKEPWPPCTAWCRKLAMMVVFLGLLVGAVASIKELRPNEVLLFRFSIGLLFLSVGVGFWQYVTQLKGRDLFVEEVITETLALRETEGYAAQARQEQDNLRAQANHTSKIGDLNL
nr:hypothetical protein [Paraburkholderia sp. BL8N3]